MTKSSGRKKKKPFNHLHKGGALPTRKEYIDTEYINGVKDSNGKMVMRPLTNEEKAWLNKFYQETVSTDFNESQKQEYARLKLRSLKKEHREYKKTNKKVHSKVQKQQELVEKLRNEEGSFYSKDKDRAELYKEDYSRRMDIFNNAKISGKLINFDLDEYDQFTSRALDSIDGETISIEGFIKPFNQNDTTED